MISIELQGLDRVHVALKSLGLDAAIVSPGQPMPTVPLAAEAVDCTVDQIIKTVVFIDPDGEPVIAIASGTRRINRQKLASAAGIAMVRLAAPEFVLQQTGYPAGGVSPIGIRNQAARIVIDIRVLDQSEVYGGAGTEDDLLRIRTDDLVKATGGNLASITD